LIKRFLQKIKIQGNCWIWQGSKDSDGYAKVWRNKTFKLAHRFIYEYYHGNIDSNLTLDHLCRTHACVNPAHLEQVTIQENVLRGEGIAAQNARKTHCPKGHEYSGYNNRGTRICKICLSENALKYYYAVVLKHC